MSQRLELGARPARILMVDANRSGLQARKAVLEELGAEVTTTTQPEEALRWLAETRYDLLITDHRRSRLDGVALIRRARELHPDMPVILLCAEVEALGLLGTPTGADLLITKSANELVHLTRAIARLLRSSRRKPPLRHTATGQAATRKVSHPS